MPSPLPTCNIFVSSTWLDLQDEQRAVEEALARMRETKFVGMERFGTRSEDSLDASLAKVDKSHLYIGIIAGRYGSGITEAEYRRARERKLPCFIYFKDDSAVPVHSREVDAAKNDRLTRFKQELRVNHKLGANLTFRGLEDLKYCVTSDLHRWIVDNYLRPQLDDPASSKEDLTELIAALQALTVVVDQLIRPRESSNEREKVLHQVPSPAADFVGRESERTVLFKALQPGDKASIAIVKGMAGVGKSELMLQAAHLLKPYYPDAQLFVDWRAGRTRRSAVPRRWRNAFARSTA
jgi:hypothetical protein